MAKKITALVCGVSWACFGLSFVFTDSPGTLSQTGALLFTVGVTIGIFSLIVLAALALIDYARRPR